MATDRSGRTLRHVLTSRYYVVQPSSIAGPVEQGRTSRSPNPDRLVRAVPGTRDIRLYPTGPSGANVSEENLELPDPKEDRWPEHSSLAGPHGCSTEQR